MLQLLIEQFCLVVAVFSYSIISRVNSCFLVIGLLLFGITFIVLVLFIGSALLLILLTKSLYFSLLFLFLDGLSVPQLAHFAIALFMRSVVSVCFSYPPIGNEYPSAPIYGW